MTELINLSKFEINILRKIQKKYIKMLSECSTYCTEEAYLDFRKRIVAIEEIIEDGEF